MTDSKSSRDRKRTPDVLADLLSADLQIGQLPPTAPVVAQAPAPVRKAQPPREPKARGPIQVDRAPETWEVETVSFQDHRGWRPRYVNGVEVKDWLTGPLLHDYINQRGAEGWELAAASSAPRLYGASDSLQLYFKRPK